MKTNITLQTNNQFKKIFEPERIAIVGVATEGFGFGRGILISLQSIGYNGDLLPVNPKGGEINGLTIYKSIQEIPGTIDFGIIAVPAPKVPEAVEACFLKGAAGVEILSSGFRETDTPEGIKLENELKKIASKGIRIIGPNCFGIYCPKSGLTFLPGPDLSREPGSVAFLSQSGGLSIDFAHIGNWKGLKFSKMVSFGNGSDIRETELLEYLASDSDTGIIGMYIEGVDNGRKFFTTLREVCLNKPVIILKGGLSEAGSRAAQSHTASMGGKKIIWESVIRQCNAIQAADLQELSDFSLAFSMLPQKQYHGISVIGGGGALGVAAADAAEEYGIVIPEFENNLKSEIMELLPKPGSSARNPIDIANPYVTPDILNKVLLLAAQDKNIDLQIVIQLLYHYKALAVSFKMNSIKTIIPYEAIANSIEDAAKKTGKPIIMVLPDYRQDIESLEVTEIIRKTKKILLNKGIPVYDDLRSALKSIYTVSHYYQKRELQRQK